MRTWSLCWVAAPAIVLLGCDYFKAPRMAIPTNKTRPVSQSQAKPPARLQAHRKYMGKTCEEWGEALSDPNPETVRTASVALRVLGSEGRPYLIQGLESNIPETRRMCLENLTVSDLRGMGDDGRKLLVRLSGDRSDLRIRERATQYLALWDQHVPSP
jgi:hypothetical protein